MNKRIWRAGGVALMAALFGSLAILFVALSVSGQADTAPPFSLSVDPPATTVYQGQSAAYAVGIDATTGFTPPVTLSVAPGPELVGVLSPTLLHAGETATLVLTTSLGTTPGMHAAVLTGTATLISGTTPTTLSATTQVTLAVLPADFELLVTPATISTRQGERAVFLAAITSTTPGFAWPVALDATGVPTGASFAFSPSQIALGSQATLLVTTTGDTAPGTHSLTVRGTVGELVRAAGATLQVRAELYLPLLTLRWPLFPNQPLLQPINNPDADGNYDVRWTEPPERLALTYFVQEATDPAFTTGLREACMTTLQVCAVRDRPPGTYFYRVRGQNMSGLGPWSGVEAAGVLPPGVEPTATATPDGTSTPYPTVQPVTATPTPRIPVETATPTPTPLPPGPFVIITHIFYDGVKGPAEPDEYVEIRNIGDQAAQLLGWSLRDEDLQAFTFPNYLMAPGQTCRVYTDEDHPEWCGFSFGSPSAIWNNSGDCAQLIDADGGLVDEVCY
jgi:hypothetical protein